MRRAPLHILTILMLLATRAHAEPQPTPQPVNVVAEMIDNAEPGTEIRIPAGIYEGNLVIRKPVVIDGSAGAIFDGLGKGTVIEVLAPGVTIRGCTVRASGQDVTGEPSAIRVKGANAIIESNVIEDALFGIDLRESPDAVIRNNTITCKDLEPGRRGDGIRLWWSHGCTVENNRVTGSRDMVFWYSEDLRITGNHVTDSRYGLHFMYSHDTVLEANTLERNSVGVYLMYSNDITLIDNTLLNNRGSSGYGIGLKDCDGIIIQRNRVLANRVGMYIDNSPSSIDSTGLIEQNVIAFNEIGILATPNTHDNVVTGNGFLENEEQVGVHGRGDLTLNKFSRDGRGNFWSDYAGFDRDDDAIGDLPYEARSLFESFLSREPNLRLFVHSPAQQAIDFTARAFPEFRPDPKFIDPAPLTRAPTLDAPATTGASARPAAIASILLLLGAGALTWAGSRAPSIRPARTRREALS